MHPEQTLGVINFVGGWFGEKYPGAELVNQTLFERGARYARQRYSSTARVTSSTRLVTARRISWPSKRSVTRGTFFAFDEPSDVGHNVIHYPELWAGPIGDYLNSLSEGH